MEIIVTVLTAFPLGFFVRNRLAAFVAYIAVHAFVFVFQTLNLLLEWMNNESSAFGPYPKYSGTELLSYGVVNLVIYLAGFGLVWLGSRTARRRRGARGAVDLESARV